MAALQHNVPVLMFAIVIVDVCETLNSVYLSCIISNRVYIGYVIINNSFINSRAAVFICMLPTGNKYNINYSLGINCFCFVIV